MEGRRAFNNSGWLWGAGFNFRKNHLLFSVNFADYNDFGFYIDKNNRFDIGEYYSDYYYVDDDLKLNYFKISIGVAYTLRHKIAYKYL